jgi:hypothetical protein
MKALPRNASEMLTQCSDIVDNWLERHERLFLSLASALFLLSAIGHSRVKELWLDELASMIVAGLPTPGAIWNALAHAIQQDPPGYHLLAHYFYRIFSSTPLVARAPAMAGYLLMSLSFYFLIRRHCPAIYAAAAFFLPGITFLRQWAWEARPYGLMLGVSALCLLFWDGASSGKRSALNRIGLAVTIALALSLHFFGMLLVGGLIVGEAGKWAIRKRLDLPAIAAIFIGASSFLLWVPLVRDDFAIMRPLYRDRVVLTDLFSIWNDTLTLAPLVLLIALLVGVCVVAGEMPRRRGTEGYFSFRERALLAVAGGFLLAPIAAFLQGRAATGVFYSKYVMLTVFGPVLLIPLLLAGFTSRSTVAGLCLFLAAASNDAIVSARGVADLFGKPPSTDSQMLRLQSLMPAADHDVVVASPFDYLPLYYNSQSPFRDQLVFLADPQKGLTYMENGTLDKMYEGIAGIYPVRVESYDDFARTHSHFYLVTVLSTTRDTPWLDKYLESISARERRLGQVGEFMVLDVALPDSH